MNNEIEGQDTGRSQENRDITFNEYLNERISNRDWTAKEINTKRNSYLSHALKSVCSEMGIQKIQLVTLRQLDAHDSHYLRQVFTEPKDQVDRIEDWAENRSYSFSSQREALAGIHKNHRITSKSEGSLEFTAYYSLGSVEKPAKNSFCERIESAYGDLRNGAAEDEGCLFSVRTIQRDGKLTPSHILAIYFSANELKIAPKQFKSALTRLHNKVLNLFDEIEILRKLDAELFELEGAELTSKLAKTFLRADLAPADKVSFALEKLKKLLSKQISQHSLKDTVYVPEVYYVSIAYEREEGENLVNPSFQIYPHEYRRQHPVGAFKIGHRHIPSMAKYLLRHYFRWNARSASRNRFAIGSHSFSMPDEPSVTISEEFDVDLFSDVDSCVEYGRLAEILCREGGDQLFARKALPTSNGDLLSGQVATDVWGKLNTNVEDQHGNSSIIAFVVEGRVLGERVPKRRKKPQCYKQLPRAVLAIETEYHAIFSESEQRTLREIARAFSHLVRGVFHENSLLDYRRNLSEAYEDFVPSAAKTREPDLVSETERFLLASMATDATLMAKIISSPSAQFYGTTKEVCSQVYQEVFESTEIADSEVYDNAIVKDRIARRFTNAIDFVHNLSMSDGNGAEDGEIRAEDVLSEPFLDFIEACPRNFAWAGYAPSLAEALGDRSELRPPDFRLIAPGFSATGLYMAVVAGEIQQVAKLSSVIKLRRELRNYRRFVRYKMLLAARTPANGLAFDSVGSDGFLAGKGEDWSVSVAEKYEEGAYGVLVSDLASGFAPSRQGDDQGGGHEDAVQTFLDRLLHALAHNEDGDIATIEFALNHMFQTSLGLWRESKPNTGAQFYPLVRDALRLPTSDRAEGVFERLVDGNRGSDVSYEREPFPFKIRPSIEQLLHTLRLTTGQHEAFGDSRVTSNATSIIHGDLNARNLAWAAAIDHFVMIDFEHSDIGVWGTDQFRLMVNVIVELPGALTRLQLPIIDQIVAGVDWLSETWKDLSEATSYPPTVLNYLNDESEEMPEYSLVSVLQSILSSIYFDRGTEQRTKSVFATKTWGNNFRVMITLCVLKEVEYSMINVKRAGLSRDPRMDQVSAVDQILLKENLAEQLNELYAQTDLFQGGRGVAQVGSIARFLVSFELLKRVGANE